MPWKNKTELKQRYDFVQQIRARKRSVAHICRQWKVSRKTGHKWIKRYQKDGLRGLQNKPSVARKHGRKIEEKWRRRARQMRAKHPSWGPRKLQARLACLHGRGGSSSATLGRWLKQWKMTAVRRHRKRAGPQVDRPRLSWAKSPNEVWTVDFKGWFVLGDGRQVEPLTVRDLASRYVLAVHPMKQQNIEESLPVFAGLFRRYGMPDAIRADNGSPFGSKGALGLTRLSAWWVRLGVKVQFIRPGHPEDNAGHEHFHRVLKAETARPPAQTWRGQHRRMQQWVRQYNEHRPHEALGMEVPAKRYQRRRRKLKETLPALLYPKDWESRRVKPNGIIHWRGQERFIGEAFGKYRAGLKSVGKIWRVYFGKLLLGELRPGRQVGMYAVRYRHRK